MSALLKDHTTGGTNRHLTDIPKPIADVAMAAYQQLDGVCQNCLQRMANPLAILTCGTADAKSIKTRAEADLKQLVVFGPILVPQ